MLSETLRIPVPKKPARRRRLPPGGGRDAGADAAGAEPRRKRSRRRAPTASASTRSSSGSPAAAWPSSSAPRRSGVEGFQKIVAIKKILPHIADDEEFITMFADEAKLAAQLNHPNIVHIYDLGKIEAGGYFIAMEYVDGRDLRSILQSAREHGPAAAGAARGLRRREGGRRRSTTRTAAATPTGDELNIVHRDVSPQNILISYEGDIKLCDFGIAKAASKVSQTEIGRPEGQAPVHVARAGLGQADRPPERHLLARRACSTRC